VKAPLNRDDWAPPQFGLKHLLIITVAGAVVSLSARTFGFDGFFPSVVGLCALWAAIAFIRLVRSSNENRDE